MGLNKFFIIWRLVIVPFFIIIICLLILSFIFIVLGLLLLAVSYGYNRFKNIIFGEDQP